LITSPTGAAVRDFLEVVGRRWRGLELLIIPTRVQGQEATAEIVAALQLANQLRPPFDALVVTRGGGSMEDLWCFNEEAVVRAIFASTIPVVAAIGHEIDVTLSDLVADQRALTPTEAAERLVPSSEDVRALLGQLRQRMRQRCQARLETARGRVDALAARRVLRSPLDSIRDRQRRLDELQWRTQRAMENRLQQFRQQAGQLAGRLETLNPTAVLARGYTITQRDDDGTLVTHADSLTPGTRIRTRYRTGTSISRVELTDAEDPHSETRDHG
jgi:exodeoxyribonuclease VII large subunit